MTEEQADKLREAAYDEVMELHSLEFLHYRLDHKDLLLEQVVMLWKNQKNGKLKNN